MKCLEKKERSCKKLHRKNLSTRLNKPASFFVVISLIENYVHMKSEKNGIFFEKSGNYSLCFIFEIMLQNTRAAPATQRIVAGGCQKKLFSLVFPSGKTLPMRKLVKAERIYLNYGLKFSSFILYRRAR